MTRISEKNRRTGPVSLDTDSHEEEEVRREDFLLGFDMHAFDLEVADIA